jgi:hypothetical protein
MLYHRSQQGIATVLIVLLVGISMTALAIGLAQSVKSTQHKNTAVHAAMTAQSAAWSGVETFKRYLASLNATDLEALALNAPIALPISGVSTSLSATVAQIDVSKKNSDGIFITANISAVDQQAESTASIQVVYKIFNGVCTLCQTLGNGQLDLFDLTLLGGDISFSLPPGGVSTLNVDGNVNALNIALNGLTRLNSTGNVTLGSAVPIQEVYVNGNLTLDGNSRANKASVLGSTFLKNNGGANLIYSNGPVEMDGGATTTVNSRSNVTLTRWVAQNTIIAGGTVSVNAPIQRIDAVGNITLSAWTDARNIATQSRLTCPSPYWNSYTRLEAAAGMSNCPAASAAVNPAATVTVPVMAELAPFTRTKPQVDAWAVKADANYAFEYTATGPEVTVKNVNGLSDGVYKLGKITTTDPYSIDYKYLCHAVNASGVCTTPASLNKSICQGHSASNGCIGYNTATGTWVIDGKNMAPGIVWLQGNLFLRNGVYYNTFALTGDILTQITVSATLLAAGAMKVYAPNFIGFSATCNNAFPLNASAEFAGQYPTQLCNTSALNYQPLANVALLAGGVNPVGSVYQGGNIHLTASSEIFGTVLAGNYLDTFGDIIVHGYIAATANVAAGSGRNDLGGRTVIKLDDAPSTYRPDEIPLFNGASCTSSCGGGGGAEVLWTRYL